VVSGPPAAGAADDARRGEADEVVAGHMFMALAVGLIPVPVADVAALMAIQVRMVANLADLYGVEFSQEVGHSLIGSLLGAGGSTLAASTVRRLLVRLVPIGGWLAGAVSGSAFAGASTFAVGRVFTDHFARGGTVESFDPDQARDYYVEQLEQGRDEVAKGLGGDF
jgi:uncharacterized protein (DUF697 family)